MKNLVALIFIFSFLLLISCENENNLTIENDNETGDETGETADENPDETTDEVIDDDVEYKCLHHCWDNPYKNYNSSRFTESGEGVETILTDSHTALQWTRTIGQKNWHDAIDQCENLTYSGYSDWELPDIYELTSPALGFDKPFPEILKNYIGGWSSTTYSADNNKVFTSRFTYTTSSAEKTESREFNCVRGKTSEYVEEKNRFIKETFEGQETIYDKKTTLKWKLVECSKEDWEKGWRYPDLFKLRTIINWNKNDPSSDFPEIESSVYYSHTGTDGNEDGSDLHQIMIDFTDGTIFDTYGDKEDNTKYLCVFYEEN